MTISTSFRFFSILTILVFSCLASLRATVDPGWHSELLYHESVMREYRYFVPTNYSDPRTIVVLFHDGGENMNGMFAKSAGGMKAWLDVAEREGIVLLVPNGTDLKNRKGRGRRLYWNDCRPGTLRKGKRSHSDDVEFVEMITSQLADQLQFSYYDIHAVGTGEGGMMAMRLGFEIPEKIGGVGALLCSLPLNSGCDRRGIPFPLLLMCGTRDPFFQWNGGSRKKREGYIQSIPNTRRSLIHYNHCRRSDVVTTKLDNVSLDDDTRVIHLFYPGMLNGADFSFYQIQGGGHFVPTITHEVSRRRQKSMGLQNRDFETAEVVWNFLKEYDYVTKRKAKPEPDQISMD